VTWDDPNQAWLLETADTKRYLSGAGVHAEQTVADGELQYLHGDLIASTMMTTDAAGSVAVPPVSYTAFGEPVFDPNGVATRYQYAGGWGYQTGLAVSDPNLPPNDLLGLRGVNPNLPPITLLHVGARWYDPALGRFVQRDPIGIDGGVNLYLYCGANPLASVDPLGLRDWFEYTGETRSVYVRTDVKRVGDLTFYTDVYRTERQWVMKRSSPAETIAGIVIGTVGGILTAATGPVAWVGAGCVALGGGLTIHSVVKDPEVIGSGWEPTGEEWRMPAEVRRASSKPTSGPVGP
jgi:hypothetical protein